MTALHLSVGVLLFFVPIVAPRAQTSTSHAWTPQEVKKTAVSQRDRVLLNQAFVNDKEFQQVVILVACSTGRTNEVAQWILGFGGVILRQIEEIEYLRASVPLDAFEKILHLPSVIDATIDGDPGYTNVLDTDVQTIAWNWHSRGQGSDSYSGLPYLPAAALKAENPYVPTRDIGAPQFVGLHPSFDGRGTTIAFLESSPYWSHPVFQAGRKLDGTLVPKFAGVLSGADIGIQGDRALVRMKIEVRADGDGYFRDTEGKVYRAPVPGKYRFGTFLSGTKESYSVLWNQIQGLVWIDLNQNDNFADEQPLPDANKQFKIVYLPDARYIRAPIQGTPVVVAMDAGDDALHIYEKAAWHTTACLSIMAGNHFLGGKANGVAPGSQLLPVVSNGPTLHNEIETLVLAAQNPAVDVVGQSTSIRSFPNAGESFLALMVNRIVDAYGKAVLTGSDNYGSGLGTTQDFSSANNVLSVGGYVAPETMSAFTGKQFRNDKPLGLVASSGPSANGALKPDFVTPLLSLFAYPCSGEEDDPRNARALKLFPYRLPACYSAGEGTSFAGPIASGVAALLISAAKQSHISYSPRRLRWAMRASTKYLPTYPAYRQGTGLLQVDTAWKLLSSSTAIPEITAVGPVHHGTGRFLRTPDLGPGLYEREGWTAGQSGKRTINLTRRTGLSSPQRYRVSWLGNDGTFQVQPSVQLPLGASVSVPIRIHPEKSGVHSAILNLIDPKSGYAIYQTMIVIVAADSLTSVNEFTSDNQATVRLESFRPYFIRVPKNTSALRVELQVLHGSVRLHYQDPAPLHWAERMTSYPYLAPVTDREVHREGDWSYLFARPLSGVWEFLVENSDVESADEAAFRLKVTALNAGVELAEATADGSAWLLKAHFTNVDGRLLGSVVQGEVGTMFRAASSVPASGQPRVLKIDVPPGSTNLLAEIEVPPEQKDNVDLYLYDCSSGHCYLWDIAMFGGSKQTILARNPKPGLWKALVFAERSAGKDVSFSYRDVITISTLGKVLGDTKSVERRVGEEWTEDLRVERSTAPLESRELVAWIEVVDGRAEEQETKASIYEEENPKGGPWNRPASAGVEILLLQHARP